MKHLRTSSRIFAVLAALMCLGTARIAAADVLTLMWDANPEVETAGYFVHMGTQSGSYTQKLDVGFTTTYTFSTAVPGQQYCFAVSAYFAGPVEGPRSVEVCGFSNQPPTLVNPGARSSSTSQSTTLQLQGSDPDELPVSYSATGLPPGLTLQSSTGFISGMPTTAGSYSVTATVSDGVLTASQTFTWTITASDTTVPVVTITGPTSAATHTTTTATVTLSGSASDNVGVTQVTWARSGGASGTATGTTTWTAAGIALQVGANTITVTARDAAGNTATDVLTVTYNAADTTVPTVTITAPTSGATYTATGTTVALSGTASDNVGVLQVTWANNRGGSGTATGTTSWSVGTVALQSGANVLTVTARDAAGNIASDVLTVNVNVAPTLNNPGAQSSSLAQSTSLQLAGSDANGDPLTYTAAGLPPGLSLTASNGLIAGSPVLTGSYSVNATVSDGTASASQTFVWTIAPNASAPTGTIRLAWNANTESGIAGYFVHVGVQPGVYVQKLDAALATSYIFANAVAGQRYCFAVSAYFTGPVEGPRSSEVCGYANQAPTLAAVSDQSTNAGQPATLQLTGSDPEGSVLTYSATGLPAGLSVASTTGLISGTPTTGGNHSVTATVSDGALTSSRSFSWTVVAADATAPVVTITAPTSAATFATTTSTVTLSGTASDAVGVTQVTWVNDRGGSGTATGTTTWSIVAISLQSGANVLTVTARDAAGNASTDVITVTRNSAPVLAAVSNQTSEAGRVASLQLSASDADGDMLTFGANGLPPGLSLTVSTGLIAGTPSQAGSYSVSATVFDGVQSASRTFSWTVTADVTAPVVTIAAPTTAATFAATGMSVTLSGTATDSVGVTQVVWANNRGGSGVASGTTVWTSGSIALQSGINVVTVTARDAAGNTATDTLTVTVNSAPALAAITDQTTVLGSPASLQLSGSDADGDTLTYGASGLPAGLAVNTATGVIAGTPTAAGTFAVTAAVSDDTQSVTRTFTWTVTTPVDVIAPSLTITVPTSASSYTATVSALSLAGSASDNVSVTQVTWSNDRGGSGVATGATSWSATVALQSGTNVITVTARDAAGNSATDVLTVTYGVNRAPTMNSVSNQSTRVGQWDTLQLVAADADGNTLGYAASGLPAGLSINAVTGLISGTPTTVGIYRVTVAVSDGTVSTTRSFSWTIKKRWGY